MKMKNIALGMTLVATLLGGSAVMAKSRGMHPGMGMDEMRIFRKLDLSREQRDAIYALVADQKDARKANKEKHMAFRQSMEQLVKGDNFDEAAVKSLWQENASLFEEEAIARTKLRYSIYQVLTAEQKQKMETLKAERKQRHHG